MIEFKRVGNCSNPRLYKIMTFEWLPFGEIYFYQNEIIIGLNEGKIFHAEDLPIISNFIEKVKKEIEEEKKTPEDKLIDAIENAVTGLTFGNGTRNAILYAIQKYKDVKRGLDKNIIA